MASATDIITYIGVPLAVLGVLPILWNAIRSLRIRHYLVGIIPTEVRKYVSLTADPVTGIVMASLPGMQLQFENLLATGLSSLAIPIEYMDSPLEGCSWTRHVKAGVSFSSVRGGFQRLLVDSSLHFEARGCRCDRDAFVLLAFGMGVEPNRLIDILEQNKDVSLLEDMSGDKVVSLDRSSSRTLNAVLRGGLYSSRHALAWFGVMVLRDNTSNDVYFESLTPSATSRIGTPASVPDVGKIIGCFNEVISNISLVLALRWVCYTEKIFHSDNQIVLPVPQDILLFRQSVLWELKKLDPITLKSQVGLICDHNDILTKTILNALVKAQSERVPIRSSRMMTILLEQRDGRTVAGRKSRKLQECKDSCLNMRTLFPNGSIFLDLEDAVGPFSNKPWKGDFLSFPDPNTMTLVFGGAYLASTLRYSAGTAR